MSNKEIFVTSPLMPPLEEFYPYLEKIWENKILTNGGPFHQQFEQQLAQYLGVEHVCLFANGTLALLTAFQALGITGEVITTPYSFVATSHSLLWNGLKPVFVDIDPLTFNIDPKKIERAITPHTSAILPVHCYGNPCDVENIQRIADLYGLKIIYDAAHAFGVKISTNPLVKYGDLSILSFHATKVFNTIEGGAIICPNLESKQRIDYLKNFGFADETTVVATGINGKMNELQAAYGIAQMKYIDNAIAKRKIIAEFYYENLRDIEGIELLDIARNVQWNYSYFPVRVKDCFGVSRDELYDLLKSNGINGRRYFYPLISDFPMYKSVIREYDDPLLFAQKISNEVICLPIYPDLDETQLLKVIDIIKNVQSFKLMCAG